MLVVKFCQFAKFAKLAKHFRIISNRSAASDARSGEIVSENDRKSHGANPPNEELDD